MLEARWPLRQTASLGRFLGAHTVPKSGCSKMARTAGRADSMLVRRGAVPTRLCGKGAGGKNDPWPRRAVAGEFQASFTAREPASLAMAE